MRWLMLAGIVPVVLGIVVVFMSILRSKALFMALPFVAGRNRPAIDRFLRHHKLLLILFLVGYMVMACALILEVPLIGVPLVGAALFLVAVFIYFSSLLESKLLGEIQSTVQKLMPICAKCKKMRSSDSDWTDPKSWVEIEKYIDQETGGQLTHGLCPACAAAVLSEYEDSASAGNLMKDHRSDS